MEAKRLRRSDKGIHSFIKDIRRKNWERKTVTKSFPSSEGKIIYKDIFYNLFTDTIASIFITILNITLAINKIKKLIPSLLNKSEG